MKIEYKNNIEELEKVIYYYLDNNKLFKSFKYLVTIIPIYAAIDSLISKDQLDFILCVFLIPLSYLFIKKIEPGSKRNAWRQALKQMRKNEEYFLGKKTLEIKDSYIIINYNDNYLNFKLHNRVVVDIIDDYVIIIDLNKGSNKYKLIIPNNAFENEKEKEDFIDIIKSKITAKKVKV